MIKILESLEESRKYDNIVVITENNEKLKIRMLEDNYTCRVYGLNTAGKSLITQMRLDGGMEPSDYYETTVQEIDEWISEGTVTILRKGL